MPHYRRNFHFALTVDDAWQVAQIMQGYDASDEYSRQHPANVPTQFSKGKIAIPAQLEFYGDAETEKPLNWQLPVSNSLVMQLKRLISASSTSWLPHFTTRPGSRTDQRC